MRLIHCGPDWVITGGQSIYILVLNMLSCTAMENFQQQLKSWLNYLVLENILLGQWHRLFLGKPHQLWVKGNWSGSQTVQNRFLILVVMKLCGQLVDRTRPGDFNQALMEIGATVCTPKDPSCSSCPLRCHCHANNEVERGSIHEILPIIGSQVTPTSSPMPTPSLSLNPTPTDETQPNHERCPLCLPDLGKTVSVTKYPVKVQKKKPREQHTLVSLLSLACSEDDERRWLLVQRPNKGLLASFWEFPSVDVDSNLRSYDEIKEEINCFLNLILGKNSKISKVIRAQENYKKKKLTRAYLSEVVHIFSHVRQTLHVEELKITDPQLKPEIEDYFSKKSGCGMFSEEESRKNHEVGGESKSRKKEKDCGENNFHETRDDNRKKNLQTRWCTAEEIYLKMAVSKGTKKCFDLVKDNYSMKANRSKRKNSERDSDNSENLHQEGKKRCLNSMGD
eukprot:TRINITY_DN5331_c0_g2_i2.p1 TRINITY_DN5331_c0_g2~~TRINITY_DN5331_c0_g2_i2.p1  ORF type:complete len:451 (-),score=75.93 TRINITY_DN5331_c0_g2_i2:175-1527(-)